MIDIFFQKPGGGAPEAKAEVEGNKNKSARIKVRRNNALICVCQG